MPLGRVLISILLLGAFSCFGQVGSLTDSVSFSERSPWRGSFFNWTTYGMEDAHKRDGRISSYNYMGLNYKVDFRQRVSVNQIFFLNGAGQDYRGKDVDASIDLGDLYFEYMIRPVMLLPGEIGLSKVKARIYAPLGTGSRVTNTKSQFRGYTTLEYPISRRVNLELESEFRYYFVESRSYLSENQFYVKANKQSEIRNRLTLTTRLSANGGIFQSIGMNSLWRYDVPHANIPHRLEEDGALSIGGYYSLGSVIFIGSLMHEGRIRNNEHDFHPFREDETQYSLMTHMSF